MHTCTRRELGDIKYVFNFDFTGTYYNSYVGKFWAFFHTRQFTHAWLQQGFPLPLHHARLPMHGTSTHVFYIYTVVRQAVNMYTTGQFFITVVLSPPQLWLKHQRTTPPLSPLLWVRTEPCCCQGVKHQLRGNKPITTTVKLKMIQC